MKRVWCLLATVVLTGCGGIYVAGGSDGVLGGAYDQWRTDRELRAEEARSARAHAICDAHPGWQIDLCNAITREQVRIGMTPEQVRLAWGEPLRINRTISVYGNTEQWVIGGKYLYFAPAPWDPELILLNTIQD